MKSRIVLAAFCCVILSATAGTVFAQALSDLDTPAFESLSKGGEKRAPSSPFTGGVSTAEDLTLEDLVLSGIAINEGRAYALISGYLVQRGDRIAGFRVESIERNRVILRRADEVYVLTMGGQ